MGGGCLGTTGSLAGCASVSCCDSWPRQSLFLSVLGSHHLALRGSGTLQVCEQPGILWPGPQGGGFGPEYLPDTVNLWSSRRACLLLQHPYDGMDGPQVESVGDSGSGWPRVYHHHLRPSRYQGLCPHPPCYRDPLFPFQELGVLWGLGAHSVRSFGGQGQGPGDRSGHSPCG